MVSLACGHPALKGSLRREPLAIGSARGTWKQENATCWSDLLVLGNAETLAVSTLFVLDDAEAMPTGSVD